MWVIRPIVECATDGRGPGSDTCPYVVRGSYVDGLGRELFPGSDCLKWSERRPMLLAELAYYASADIVCLQVGGSDAIRTQADMCRSAID